MKNITVPGNEQSEYEEWHELNTEMKMRYLGMALAMLKIKLTDS